MSTRKKVPAKKAVAKKAVAKKAVAKKAVAKKAVAKQAVAKQAVAKQAVAKQAVAKKAPVKRSADGGGAASNDSFAAAFEQRFGFPLPADYARALEDDRLSYRMDLKKERFNSYREDPPLLICSPRVEWMTPKEILKHEFPEYFVTDPQLVCFASGAAGEYWCFVPDWADDGEVPIAFIEPDVDDAKLVAPHFSGMVFAEIVESLGEWESWVNAFNKLEVPSGELAEFARKVLATSAPYLRPAHIEVLESLVARPLSDEGAFLSSSEVPEIIEKHLAYPRWEEEFQAHVH